MVIFDQNSRRQGLNSLLSFLRCTEGYTKIFYVHCSGIFGPHCTDLDALRVAINSGNLQYRSTPLNEQFNVHVGTPPPPPRGCQTVKVPFTNVTGVSNSSILPFFSTEIKYSTS